MRLLATIRGIDVDIAAPVADYTGFRPRTAARAVIFDNKRVALIHVTKHHYYMLPGGGIEDEDLLAGLAREVGEEMGFAIKVGDAIGKTVTYIDRWHSKQTDFGYVARRVGRSHRTALIPFEQAEGFEVVWAPSLTEAIKLSEAAAPDNLDGKLVRTRDLIFLKIVQERQLKDL